MQTLIIAQLEQTIFSGLEKFIQFLLDAIVVHGFSTVFLIVILIIFYRVLDALLEIQKNNDKIEQRQLEENKNIREDFKNLNQKYADRTEELLIAKQNIKDLELSLRNLDEKLEKCMSREEVEEIVEEVVPNLELSNDN